MKPSAPRLGSPAAARGGRSAARAARRCKTVQSRSAASLRKRSCSSGPWAATGHGTEGGRGRSWRWWVIVRGCIAVSPRNRPRNRHGGCCAASVARPLEVGLRWEEEKMTEMLARLVTDDRGQDLAEYAIALAVIGRIGGAAGREGGQAAGAVRPRAEHEAARRAALARRQALTRAQ